jgi:hypothetical protein
MRIIMYSNNEQRNSSLKVQTLLQLLNTFVIDMYRILDINKLKIMSLNLLRLYHKYDAQMEIY